MICDDSESGMYYRPDTVTVAERVGANFETISSLWLGAKAVVYSYRHIIPAIHRILYQVSYRCFKAADFEMLYKTRSLLQF